MHNNVLFLFWLMMMRTLQEVCSHLSAADISDEQLLQQLHDAVNVYYNYSGLTPCFNISQTASSSLQVTGWDFQVAVLAYVSLSMVLTVSQFFRTA